MGLDTVVVVDHGSTYPPMLDWLEEIDGEEGVATWWSSIGHHPRDLWTHLSRPGGGELIEYYAGLHSPYLVTDCDVVPDNPRAGFVAVATHLLSIDPRAKKVGMALRLEPACEGCPSPPPATLEWESAFWREPGPVGTYRAPVDTTLALYRPLAECRSFALAPALRTTWPHVATHLPWFEEDPTAEDLVWYRDKLPSGISHWSRERPYE